MARPKRLINPKEFLERKQLMESKLSEPEQQRQVFPLLAHWWVILRGIQNERSEAVVTQHIVMLQIFAAQISNKPLYELTTKAVPLWLSALDLSQKRGTPPDLSTSAKKAISQCIKEWDKALKCMPVGMLVYICERWQAIERKFCIGEAA